MPRFYPDRNLDPTRQTNRLSAPRCAQMPPRRSRCPRVDPDAPAFMRRERHLHTTCTRARAPRLLGYVQMHPLEREIIGHERGAVWRRVMVKLPPHKRGGIHGNTALGGGEAAVRSSESERLTNSAVSGSLAIGISFNTAVHPPRFHCESP